MSIFRKLLLKNKRESEKSSIKVSLAKDEEITKKNEAQLKLYQDILENSEYIPQPTIPEDYYRFNPEGEYICSDDNKTTTKTSK